MVASSTTTSAGGPIFFWREFEEPNGFLSQWYASTFTAPVPHSARKCPSQMIFFNTEQYMMYHKAMLFNDQEVANSIMLEPSPKKQRALGRKVKNFDSKKWDMMKEQIVEDGNWWKMTQSKECDLGQMLLETGDRELVEASPFDRVWGVGYGEVNAESNREQWGENLLGKALMRVRDRLQIERRNGRH